MGEGGRLGPPSLRPGDGSHEHLVHKQRVLRGGTALDREGEMVCEGCDLRYYPHNMTYVSKFRSVPLEIS